MWVVELRLQNIKCFEDVTIRLGENDKPYPWITFLSENGGGKSTALQALALLLAGHQDAQILLPRPIGWLREITQLGLISTQIRQDKNDGKFLEENFDDNALGISYIVDNAFLVPFPNKKILEAIPQIDSENGDRTTIFQRHFPDNKGCFAVGYGAFRRLKRQIDDSPDNGNPIWRAENFLTQFREDIPLTTFNDWMRQLDYRISKTGDPTAKRHLDIGIAAINALLPEGTRFEAITDEGQVTFNVNGVVVPTLALSDGYRSVLALAGDLIYRLIRAFPESERPLEERGVVLIDELDIHLHPTWQREIAGWLRKQFPNLQFIVATHSPLIVAGAGQDAVTYKFELEAGKAQVHRVENQTFKSVENVMTGEAFGLESPFSPEAQETIDEYDTLTAKEEKLTKKERAHLEKLRHLLRSVRPFRRRPQPGSLEARIEDFLDKTLK